MAAATGGGARSSSRSTTGLDPQTQQWVSQIFRASQTAAGTTPPGVDPLTTQAGQFYGDQMAGAARGAAALGGDAAATAALSNPYTEQVIDASRQGFDALQQRTARDVASQATAAGAFGGSRAAVAQGVAQAANTRDQAQMEAALRNQGFEGAMQRAGALTNFGFGAAQGAQGVGAYNRDVALQTAPGLWQQQVLRQGLLGLPYGTTQNTAQAQAQTGFNFGLGPGSR